MFKLKEYYQYKRELVTRNKLFKSRVLYRIQKVFPFYNNFLDISGLGDGIIYLRSSQNNTIVTLTDLKGKVVCVKSCGCLGFNGKKKRSTKFAIESTFFSVVAKAKESGYATVAVFFNGFSKGRFYVLNSFLKKSNLKLSIICDVTSVPHNGCRPRKLRRG